MLSQSVVFNSLWPHELCSPPGSSVWNSPGKNNWSEYFLLQGIFPTQGLNLGLPYCRQILYHLNHQGSLSNSWSWINSLLVHLSFGTLHIYRHSLLAYQRQIFLSNNKSNNNNNTFSKIKFENKYLQDELLWRNNTIHLFHFVNKSFYREITRESAFVS